MASIQTLNAHALGGSPGNTAQGGDGAAPDSFCRGSYVTGRTRPGFERSISEYERYAGLDFKARLARMPTPMRFSTTIEIDVSSIEDRNDYKFWIFSLRSLDDVEIYRRDIYDPDVLTKKVRELRVDASLEDEPVDYMLWPYVHGRGFQQRHYHDL